MYFNRCGGGGEESTSVRVHVTLLSATRVRPKLSWIPALDMDNCIFSAEEGKRTVFPTSRSKEI